MGETEGGGAVRKSSCGRRRAAPSLGVCGGGGAGACSWGLQIHFARGARWERAPTGRGGGTPWSTGLYVQKTAGELNCPLLGTWRWERSMGVQGGRGPEWGLTVCASLKALERHTLHQWLTPHPLEGSLGGWILPEGEEAWHLLSDNFEMPKHIDDKRDLLYISCPKNDHIIVSRISHQPRGRHRFCSGGAPSGPPRPLCSTPSPPDEDCFPPSRQQPSSYPTGPVLRRRPPPDPNSARFHSCCCLVCPSRFPPPTPPAPHISFLVLFGRNKEAQNRP